MERLKGLVRTFSQRCGERSRHLRHVVFRWIAHQRRTLPKRTCRFLLQPVPPPRDPPINYALRDKVYEDLQTAHCAVIHEVMHLCHEINRIEEEKISRIETKAGIYFGLNGALIVFIVNILLKSKVDGLPSTCLTISIPFLLSMIYLLLAIRPRPFLRLNGNDVFRREILSCKELQTEDDTKWIPNYGTHQDLHERAFRNSLHAQEHSRRYMLFVIEQYWDNTEHNSALGEKKARFLITAGFWYLIELVLVLYTAWFLLWMASL